MPLASWSGEVDHAPLGGGDFKRIFFPLGKGERLHEVVILCRFSINHEGRLVEKRVFMVHPCLLRSVRRGNHKVALCNRGCASTTTTPHLVVEIATWV